MFDFQTRIITARVKNYLLYYGLESDLSDHVSFNLYNEKVIPLSLRSQLIKDSEQWNLYRVKDELNFKRENRNPVTGVPYD